MSHIADVNEAISHAEAIALMPGLPPLAGERLGCLLVVLDRVRAEWPEPQAAPGVTPLVEAIRAELGVPLITAADKVRRLVEVKDAAVASAKHWLDEVERLRAERAEVAKALSHTDDDPGWSLVLSAAHLAHEHSQLLADRKAVIEASGWDPPAWCEPETTLAEHVAALARK